MGRDNTFYKVFGDNPPKIGMLHLAGWNTVDRALDEIKIYENAGIDAIIVENYHGSIDAVESTLNKIKERETELVVGVNILPKEYSADKSIEMAFDIADKYGAEFIQLDYVAGNYYSGELNEILYEQCRQEYPEIAVLGGVWPKYYIPIKGSNLEKDLHTGMKRADAIVVTGSGTGAETPIEKILKFRKIIGDEFPLIVGAGVTPDNAYEQLMNTDGVIVGSSLKPDNDTEEIVNLNLVQKFVEASKIPMNTTYVRNTINWNLEEIQAKWN